MPLFKTINIGKNSTIVIWKISETVEELQNIPLCTHSLHRLSLMKSEQHQKGFLSIRHLFKHLGILDHEVTYSQNGKPIITNQHISISHTLEYGVVALSNYHIGVDMEHQREKILQIQHKFNTIDLSNLTLENQLLTLTKIWCSKEALYKIHPTGGISLKEDLNLELLTNNQFKAQINTPNFNQEFDIYIHQYNDAILAIALAI